MKEKVTQRFMEVPHMQALPHENNKHLLPGQTILKMVMDTPEKIQENDSMSNLLDYLTWKNDLTFSKVPCCVVDTLICSYLSYLQPQPVFARQDMFYVKRASETIRTTSPEEIHFRVKEDLQLLHEMAEGDWYRNIILYGYAGRLDPSTEKQFYTLTCLLEGDVMLIAYRGMDNTLAGRREDFSITFLDTIPSQEEAVQYLETITIIYLDRRIILCGHSKSGDFVIYTAAFRSFAIQNRIQRVYNHGGPGFSVETLQAAGHRSIAQHTETFVPQPSVVGMLMEHEEHYAVISNTQISLWQHDPYSWEVPGSDFARLDASDHQNIILDSTIKYWISELGRSQRETFTGAVLQIFSNTNAVSSKEMSESRMRSATPILKTLNRTDKQTKKTLSDIILKLLSSVKNTIKINLENRKPTG